MNRNFIDITGQKFGKLIVIKFVERKNKVSYWLCKCDCGKEKIMRNGNLTSGNTKSCGCLFKCLLIERITKHGMTGTKFHRVWRGMIERCEDLNHRAYPNYGGREIEVCKRWHKFENFYEDMYESYLKHKKNNKTTTLERENVNGNYNKENCSWQTRKVQANNKRNNRLITYKGKTQTMMQWSEELNISYDTLKAQLKKHKWSIEKTLTFKSKKYDKKANS